MIGATQLLHSPEIEFIHHAIGPMLRQQGGTTPVEKHYAFAEKAQHIENLNKQSD